MVVHLMREVREARVRKLIVVAFAVINLSGCAAHSIDCALGTPHADCAQDTAGHQAALEEQRATQMTATIDDARCRSYGEPGSPSYTQCRADLDKQRAPAAR
jgi:hypothetical protein